MDDRLVASRNDFVELMGRAMEAEGMPRIGGRIVGLLLFEGRPYSFSELATELGVSRGSISSNTRLLVEREMIAKCSRPGDRQDYFRVADDLYGDLLSGVCRRIRRTSGDIRRIVGELPDEGDTPRERLERFADFYDAVADGIQVAADKVRAQRDTAA
ncbi:GbsR/MarR family transcriptional regulator [Rubellimicrobium arenae]|uniref:GbsR/MarR family transcriptional regulator n=1 Tax=Rubellimicrobium arenae TaxID=2817372 RepID=UPI001B30C614|nr:hypothetical protein [Rubellimicrobium arenae]